MSEIKNEQLASDLRTVTTRLIKKLRKKSATGSQLSLTERSTMSLLYKGEYLPSELAAMEKITNQSMSQILSHLLELGYITRTASITDKRKVLISLSAEGEKTLLRVRSERDEWIKKAVAETCDAEEQELLRKAIITLTKLVDFD
ncbi:MarR family winged helix-turn-helix transcriptional regulator [Mucilaginibacter segetis]|uniref:MarR family transcriptional regulator n=1 Tax=Mucilaginibacter segetis TaxID=2793071 RepID=A0A934PUU1_9SPHI|nr:MarR family transcriptional regulator [Mucilaginibacter segetis]MBK0380007.1 MarR family transcriptional regulator [Mucilaginibacter segetis]